MATASKLELPGNFEKGKNYLMSGATLMAWKAALLADRIVPGQGQTESGTPQGRVIHGTAVAAGEVAFGAFYGLVVIDGDTYLQGGTVSGGTGNETVANIKIIDSVTGIMQTAGNHMYIDATGSGVEADGVLLPGWNLSSATISYASSLPANTLPTAASPSGKHCRIDLGVFTETTFLPAGSGNVQITSCPGSYSVNRS